MSAAATPGPAGCPSCGQPAWPADNFCEACRAELAPARVSGERAAADGRRCSSCPEATITPEGYCESCGRKVPSGADRSELDLGLLAGITDRGRRHRRNEDAMAIGTARTEAGPAAVAVVCDGVSSSSRADEASRAAAGAAVRILLAAVRSGGDPADASRRAFGAAQQALFALASSPDSASSEPAATYVSAVVTAAEVTVCWLGDSRAYWLDPSGAGSRQLTSDDSIAQELVAEGLLTASEALASPAGHVVTGWVGADLREAEPHLAWFTPAGPGIVLLCSDGLWNYQPDPAGLAARALPAALADPLGAAAALVAFANDSGGSDNITAVLAAFPPRDRPSDSDHSERAGRGIPEASGRQGGPADGPA